MKVAIIVGSIRKERQSHKVGLYLKRVLDSMPTIKIYDTELLKLKIELVWE